MRKALRTESESQINNMVDSTLQCYRIPSMLGISAERDKRRVGYAVQRNAHVAPRNARFREMPDHERGHLGRIECNKMLFSSPVFIHLKFVDNPGIGVLLKLGMSCYTI